ncbi:hypothetical protein F4782DRAFT_540010 [Xylaria castorea]|nr:hypothetical protein F4782DRAFT_540010 [Xylaria castorea]
MAVNGEQDACKRVEHERDRIAALRARFRGNLLKQSLMKELDTARNALRDVLWRHIPEHEDGVKNNQSLNHEQRAAQLEVLRRLKRAKRPIEENETVTGEKRGHSHNKCEEVYPNQKFPMQDILDRKNKESSLAQMPNEDELRYLYFPANNMEWIEKAMDILCGGDSETPDATAQTGKILAREFWRGQMYGSGERGIISNETRHAKKRATGPIHARHMRSRCSIIPRAKSNPSPQDPTRSASDWSKNGGKNIVIYLPYLHWETSSRRARMAKIVDEVTRSQEQKNINRQNLADVVEKKLKPTSREKPKYRHYIGDYLMAIAKVAEEMDYEDDEHLLRESISAEAPLHIRRTLDQYYFPTLEDTSARDRDQVVYRGTKYGTPRVVMVDQLWLWIINDNTIITSFPRRWGRNKPDPSGVHKSLRERLEQEEISSIHHLALIIIDQCSRVFFDRTKSLDQRPEVMDLFASAIGYVTEQTAVSYDSFWRNLSIGSSIRPSVDGNLSHHKRLDINPEGVILQEAQDIAEELRMMGQVFTGQWKVTKNLKRYLKYPGGEGNEQSKELAAYEKLLVRLLNQRNSVEQDSQERSPKKAHNTTSQTAIDMQPAAYEATVLLEHIEDRRVEIQDLESSALRICQQLEGLLSLKQQQASIVEAKAALRRADESVKQGRAIMAFTLVTIFFLPLGFVATFFGMNNREINGADWLSLDEQIRYMFVVTTATVIVIHTGLYKYWKASPVHHEKLEGRASRFLGEAERRRYKRNLKSRITEYKSSSMLVLLWQRKMAGIA